MIKRIFFFILLVILIVLSVTLYNQYNMLPDETVADINATENEGGKLLGTWAPPSLPQKPEPQEDQTKELASWQEGSDQRDLQSDQGQESSAPDSQEAGPDDDGQATKADAGKDSQPQEAPPPPPDEASETNATGDSPPAPSAAEQASAPESTPAMPDTSAQPEGIETSEPPETPETDEDHVEERSKAEKALSRGKAWLSGEGNTAGRAISALEGELDNEQKVIRDMKLSPGDTTSPNIKVNQLVKKIEKKALESDQEFSPSPATPGAGQAAPESAQPEEKASAPEQTSKPRKPQPKPSTSATANTLMSLDLASDGEAVMLRVTTQKPLQDYTEFQIHGPKRFVLDLHGRFTRSVPRVSVLPNAMIEDLRTGLHKDKLRIVADLHDDVTADISVERKSPTELTVIMRPKR